MPSSQHDEPAEPPPAGGFDPDDHWGWSAWEWWARCAVALAALALVAWIIIWLNHGIVAVATHAFVVPVLGVASLPVVLWGLVRTTFHPPLLRRSRLVSFALLLGVGFVGNVHIWAAPAAPFDREASVDFRLPFEGAWYTMAGGPKVARNHNATTAAWRWGYDFTVRNESGQFRHLGGELADYPCYGRSVVAPASGKVVSVASELKDAEPGEFDESSVLGNHLVVRISDGEYLFVAHLKKDSISHDEGDDVTRGETIGACGNSGRAVFPHVHIHLQDRRSFPVARGLPMRFSRYTADGEFVEEGMPRGEGEGGSPEGDVVEHVGNDRSERPE